MEEEKAAAYYDELTRKGEGAARFKQGLGFSSSSSTTNDGVPARGSALPTSSSSFLSTFVRASSPSKATEIQKQAQLETIQNKLKKKSESSHNHSSSRVSIDRNRDRDRHSRQRSRSRSRDRDRDRHSRRRSRSRSRGDRGSRHRHRSLSRDRYRDRNKDRDKERRRKRSRSRSVSDEERGRRSGRGRSRSVSPQDRRSEKSRGDRGKVGKERNGGSGTDYGKLIEGYDKMTPAERVKAKMKLQLSETAEKDETKSMGSGWERFEFNKDAPLDDEEIEAAEDDAGLVKHIGQSFRFSAVTVRREEEIKAAHDKAMFGTSARPLSVDTDENVEEDNDQKENTGSAPVTSLISEQVLTMQQGSWRERARKV
ncbi:unnamed protein product [Ilex paraguariensis]|uniref:Uncharacterized protein n=1 Tax=Ilex paraguariensis TaxID=185542 RepID=A0ABC8R103_9AQUA